MATVGILQSYMPSGNTSQAQATLAEDVRRQQSGFAGIDAGVAQSRLTDNYLTQQLPQLRNQSAASGQFFSSGRQLGEQNAYKSFVNSDADIVSALARKRAELMNQRNTASIGMIGL